jgi:hypothetical protein
MIATVATAKADDSALVAIARHASVHTLDSTLADMPFAEWVASVRPAVASAIEWGVNDCGEGGDGRVAPFCVGATLTLPPDTTAGVYLIIAGPDRVAGAPEVFYVWAMVGDSTRSFKTLSAWAAFVRPR